MPAAAIASLVFMSMFSESVCRLPRSLIRMQDQLLDPPVHDFRNIEFVFRGASDFVNPSELLGLFTRAAKDTENFPVERHLVQAAGKCIGRIQYLIRTGRDADRPRGALMLASGRPGRRHRS